MEFCGNLHPDCLKHVGFCYLESLADTGPDRLPVGVMLACFLVPICAHCSSCLLLLLLGVATILILIILILLYVICVFLYNRPIMERWS